MIISNENRYIFIAVPKTGTTSVQKLLLEHDPTARTYGIEIEGKNYRFGEHDTALQIKTELGSRYADYRTFGFIRNPYSRLVSSYFFYRNGKPITKGNKKPWPTRLRVAYARLLPFKLWALTYPYKSNRQHFLDEHGRMIVDFVGTFENLGSDLAKIFEAIGLSVPADQLPHSNKSKHSSYEDYFSNESFKRKIVRTLRDDLEFYDKYKLSL